MTEVLRKVKIFMITCLAIFVVGLIWHETEFESDNEYDPVVGDEHRAIIVTTWRPDGTGDMEMYYAFGLNHKQTGPRHSWGGSEDVSPIQEREMTYVGERIEVRANKTGGKPDQITITVTIQTAKGDYLLTMLCTEPTRSKKVCVGVVPK